VANNHRSPRSAATGPVFLLPFVHLITENRNARRFELPAPCPLLFALCSLLFAPAPTPCSLLHARGAAASPNFELLVSTTPLYNFPHDPPKSRRFVRKGEAWR